MGELITIHGRAYVTLTTVATCYHVELSWVEEVYAHGLLGSGERIDGETAIAVEMLDPLAHMVRMHVQEGINLAGIASLLRR